MLPLVLRFPESVKPLNLGEVLCCSAFSLAVKAVLCSSLRDKPPTFGLPLPDLLRMLGLVLPIGERERGREGRRERGQVNVCYLLLWGGHLPSMHIHD